MSEYDAPECPHCEGTGVDMSPLIDQDGKYGWATLKANAEMHEADARFWERQAKSWKRAAMISFFCVCVQVACNIVMMIKVLAR